MKSDNERLQHILEAIQQIEKYAVLGQERFRQDELIQIWMAHYLQIIGEASSRLSEPFRIRHSVVEWKKIAGMRNIIVHDYWGLDLNIAWTAVENDLPVLKDQIVKMISEIGKEAGSGEI